MIILGSWNANLHVAENLYRDSFTVVNEDSLKMSILKNGDEKSYYDLMSLVYGDEEYQYFDYSLIMANNYHNGFACLKVYEGIMDLYIKKNVVLDSVSYALPLSYLEKGVSFNSKECMSELANLYSDSTNYFYDRIKASEYALMSYEIGLKEDIILLKEKGVYSNARIIRCTYSPSMSIYTILFYDDKSDHRGFMYSDVPLNVGDSIPIVFYKDANTLISCPSKYIEK